MAQKGRFTVRFWGVRAAIAAPGPLTVKYGGNTPCIEVRVGDDVFIVDCGTGVRDLGNQLVGEGKLSATILISRYEWDHIQGFPFFVPNFIPGNRITVMGQNVNGTSVRDFLAAQMDYPCFPVKLSDLGADIDYQDFDMEEGLRRASVHVTPLMKGDLVAGFKFQAGRKRLCYLSGAPTSDEEEKDLAKQVRSSVLVYALPQPFPNGRDLNSELWERALALAARARAKRLVVFHFAPGQDDHR